MRIEFDPAKNAANIDRRGLSFEQVADLDWGSVLVRRDERRDYGEPRYRALAWLGEGARRRLHHLAFAVRGDAMRVISFRRASKREERLYAQEKP